MPFFAIALGDVLLVHLVRVESEQEPTLRRQSRIEAELIDLIVDFEVPAVEGGV